MPDSSILGVGLSGARRFLCLTMGLDWCGFCAGEVMAGPEALKHTKSHKIKGLIFRLGKGKGVDL